MRKSYASGPDSISKKYVYPFLFALYPVLFLYSHNIREVPLARVFPALGVSLAIAVTFWLLTGIVVRTPGKRSLLLFLFLLLFHFYGSYYDLIAVWLPSDSRPLLAHAIAFILPGGLWLFLSWTVVRSARNLAVVNRVLRLTVIFLLSWSLAGILIHHGRSLLSPDRARDVEQPGAQGSTHAPAGSPDIYCFILDEFASLESARSLFQYDNSKFAATLRQLNFFVARNSRSRFHMTELAIADILNLGELDPKKDPYPLIRRNAVASFLKRRGYRIIEFPLEPLMFMDDADQRFHYSLRHVSIFFDDFYRILFERSLLRFIPELWRQRKNDLSRYYRKRVLTVFEKLPAVLKSPGPKFVFAHIFSPHEPFVFNELGENVRPGHFWDHDDPRFYLQQYKFISRKIAETVALILKDSPGAPVIIIQSDHGYRGSLRPRKQRQRVPRSEMFKVFNALYLPGMDPERIAPALSPRNNFRLVFNRYFAEHLLPLQNP